MEPPDFTGADVAFLVEGVGIIDGRLIRFYAPRTVGAITAKLPVEGRAALMRGGIYFQVPVIVGSEKARKELEAGSITYWPLTRAICLFYENTSVYTPSNLVGRIVRNVELLRKVRSGLGVKLVKRQRSGKP